MNTMMGVWQRWTSVHSGMHSCDPNLSQGQRQATNPMGRANQAPTSQHTGLFNRGERGPPGLPAHHPGLDFAPSRLLSGFLCLARLWHQPWKVSEGFCGGRQGS